MASFKIGVTGYSFQAFDLGAAARFLKLGFTELAPQGRDIEIVSGLTDFGIPGLAYRLACRLGYKTAGIACKQANDYQLFPVDRKMIVGEDWGEESETFLGYVDALLRIGGGDQALSEVEQAKKMGLPVKEYELETTAPNWKMAFERVSKLNLEEVCIMITLPQEWHKHFPKDRGGNDTSAPHCTVLYVGPVDPRRKDEFVSAVKSIVRRHKPFEASIGPLTYFSEGKYGFPAVCRVISKRIHQLQSALKSGLLHQGFPIADKWPSYKPHTTLQYVPEEGGYTGSVPNGSWLVDSVDIYGLDLSIPLGEENPVETPLPRWKAAFENLVVDVGTRNRGRPGVSDSGQVF